MIMKCRIGQGIELCFGAPLPGQAKKRAAFGNRTLMRYQTLTLIPMRNRYFIEHAERLAFDFSAALGEENPTIALAALRVPTLLFSGGQSPFMTQRIVQRLVAIMDGAEHHHLPDAGHMLPLTHTAAVNPEILRHIARADELAGRALPAGQPNAKAAVLG